MTKLLEKGNRNSLRSFRRWIKQLFTSALKRQNSEMEEVLEMLQDIQGSIEIIAREVARQIKRRK